MKEQKVTENSKLRIKRLAFIIVTIIVVMITVVFIIMKYNHWTTGTNTEMEYKNKIFDMDLVHTINIIINQKDWKSLQENADDKEYKKCDVVIDGNTFQNVAIRTKGNSSLSSVTQQGSERYSFKVEFDHYNDATNCWGLDKLSLNNIIQDPTYMKDFLSYSLMRDMGAAAPLCSYISVQVNGEEFGLYLAVEGIEESFVKRNYGSVSGNLYKPEPAYGFDNMGNGNKQDSNNKQDNSKQDNIKQGFEIGGGFGNGRGFGGMSSNASDVALKYIDDKISSYSNIFDNAILDASDEDEKRLIAAIKQLNTGEDLDKALNTDEILRYFVVHNFVDNYDSYTGSLLHNYYLYEKDGKLSMIAWDYNLAFGSFGMGQGRDNSDRTKDSASTYVNFPIDTPVSGTTMEERPLLNKLLTNKKYLEQYHDLFNQFIKKYFENGYCDQLIDKVSLMIKPYVEQDKTAFFTVDQFEKGVTTLKKFCELRTESVRGQLDNTIPSTTDGQSKSDTLIDAESITMSDLGSGFGKGNFN
jgi:spore coat protein CotH